MQVINRLAIKNFQSKHPLSRIPLYRWLEIVENTSWKGWRDLKATFSPADKVGPFAVFNIHGNSYRLIATVNFERGFLTIQQVMTDDEYNRWRPK